MKLLIVFIVGLFSFESIAQNYISLEGFWNFKTDPYENGVAEKWFLKDQCYTCWDKLDVPGNWNIENEYAYYTGTAWYQKYFNVNKGLDNSYFLIFEGIYYDSEIFLNGEKIGESNSGFLPFELDVTKELLNGANNLVIKVNNSFKLGATWNWGGIRRPIRLEVAKAFRVNYHHINSFPDLQAGTATIEGEVLITNLSTEERKIRVSKVINGDSSELWSNTTSITIPPRSNKKLKYEARLKSVEWWEPNNPYLYQSQLNFYEEGEPVWSDASDFGVRKLEVRGTQLLLNGNLIKPVGINLVPDDRIYGNSYPSDRIKEDVSLLKSLGVQFTRLSHLPLPKEFLSELDKQGIMVFEEVSVWGKNTLVDPDNSIPFDWLRRMINLKYNHPSLVGWSVGNEIGYRSDNPKVNLYVEKAIHLAKSLDPNRLAVYVSHSVGKQNDDPAKFSDIIMANRYGDYKNSAKKIHLDFPNKPIFFSELGKNLNSENPDNFGVPISEMYNELRETPSVIGASLWTLNDYRSIYSGTPAWTTPKSENRAWGLVTVFREKKNQFSDLQLEHLPFLFKINIEDRIFKISTTKRSINSFPYYDYANYKLWLKGYDSEEKLVEIYEIPVPKSKEFVLNKNITTVKYGFLDSQGNTIYDKEFYYESPSKPKIVKLHSAKDKIRIIYAKTKGATRYVASAKNNEGFEILSDTTRNLFIDIENLGYNIDYTIQLQAINNFGISYSDSLSIKTDEDILPPIIWAVRPADKSIMINFGVEDTDMTFLVRYGDTQGIYNKEFELRNYGVLKIPNLVNNKPYYFQMARRSQTGFQSEWSHELEAIPMN